MWFCFIRAQSRFEHFDQFPKKRNKLQDVQFVYLCGIYSVWYTSILFLFAFAFATIGTGVTRTIIGRVFTKSYICVLPDEFPLKSIGFR